MGVKVDLIQSGKHILRTTENSVLRKICGPSQN